MRFNPQTMRDSIFDRWFYSIEKSESVVTLANVYYPVFKRILAEVLKIKSNELVLIVGDTGTVGHRLSALISLSYYIAAKKLRLNPKLHIDDFDGEFKGSTSNLGHIISLLPEKTTIIFNLSDKLKKLDGINVKFRKYSKIKNFRFVTTTSLGSLRTNDSYKLVKAYDVDYERLRTIAVGLKRKMDLAKVASVSTKNGTNLTFGISRRVAFISDGIYDRYGTGGNLPGAEVYIAPDKDKVDGILVVDGSSRNKWGTTLIKTPIRILIKKGSVVRISGGHEADLLRKTIQNAEKKPKGLGARMIGELGIGINAHARVLGSMIIDEKTLGTAHVAIGANTSFMGSVSAPIHLDQVFMEPVIAFDGKKIRLRE